MNNHFGNSGITSMGFVVDGMCAHVTGDHILIFNEKRYEDKSIEEIYDIDCEAIDSGEDVEIWFYDLVDQIPYFWRHPNQPITDLLTEHLMDVHYIRIDHWESASCFVGTDLRLYAHFVDSVAEECVADSNGVPYYVKACTTNPVTGEISGFVCYTWKTR